MIAGPGVGHGHVQQEWDFVDPPSEEFFCPMCKQILREPMLTDCCGSHFCKGCIEPIKDTQKPCPECNQPDFLSIINKNMMKRVSELDVLCPLKGRGCHWKGEVGSRELHLDPKNENSCEFLDVECTYGCGEDMEKYELAEHLNRFCQKRPYKCEHCGLDGVYITIVSDHIPICPKYPLHCQNECGQEAVPRADYDQHLAECPEQDVQCQFHHIGCEKKVKRKNLARHQQEDVYAHLSLQTAFATQQLSERDQKLEELSRSWEQKYQQLTREIKEYHEKQKEDLVESFNRELAERDEVIAQLSLKLDEKDVLIDGLRQGIEEMKVKLKDSQKNAHDHFAKKINDQAKELEEKQKNSIKVMQGEQLAKIEGLENDQKAKLSQLKASIADSKQKSSEYLECEIKRVSLDIGKKHADLKNDVTASQKEHHLMKKRLELCEKKVSELEKMQGQLQPVAIPSSGSIKGSSEPEAIPVLSTSQYGHNVYDNMSPDALALLEKLPIGSIKGVHYDPSAGRVLIDKETPQLGEERTSKFQSAYQSITGKKLKIITVPVPSGASPDAVATLVHQYNVTYDQCVFTQEEEVIKIISISSRQIDQANVLLSGDIKKAMSSSKQANRNFEVIHLSTDRTLILKKADLVKEEVDIIVNPANERLSHAGGIAAALNRASNGQLQKHSDRHIHKKGFVRVGTIAITAAGGGVLKCGKVIHAVGPDKSYGEAKCEQLLNQVAQEVLKGAEKYNANSVSFPAISTGIFGVKKELVARCVVDTIMAYNVKKPPPVLSDIRIVIIDEKTYAPFAH